jgi:hypothetical protein
MKQLRAAPSWSGPLRRAASSSSHCIAAGRGDSSTSPLRATCSNSRSDASCVCPGGGESGSPNHSWSGTHAYGRSQMKRASRSVGVRVAGAWLRGPWSCCTRARPVSARMCLRERFGAPRSSATGATDAQDRAPAACAAHAGAGSDCAEAKSGSSPSLLLRCRLRFLRLTWRVVRTTVRVERRCRARASRAGAGAKSRRRLNAFVTARFTFSTFAA